MDIKKYIIEIELLIAIFAFFVSQDLAVLRYFLIGLLIVLGLVRWNYDYNIKSWKYVCEIFIIILFIGSLEKAFLNEHFKIYSLVLREALFWSLALLKIISIYAIRTRLLKWLRF